VTPASPEEEPSSSVSPMTRSRGVSLLDQAYQVGESSLLRLVSWAKPKHVSSYQRRRSDSDSEKGLSEEELDGADTTETATTSTSRTSVDSLGVGVGAVGAGGAKGAKYWGLGEDEDDGYFSLPPTPPDERNSDIIEPNAFFNVASGYASLPTPALSAHSLSKHNRRHNNRAARDQSRDLNTSSAASSLGWLKHLLSVGSGTKTGDVVRELGWTVGILVMSFVVTAGMALWMLQGLPM
jgi:hypothetical protein